MDHVPRSSVVPTQATDLACVQRPRIASRGDGRKSARRRKVLYDNVSTEAPAVYDYNEVVQEITDGLTGEYLWSYRPSHGGT